MKHNLFSLLFFAACAVTTQLFSQRVWAQATTASAASATGTSATGMTLEQLKAVKAMKAIKIANLDKDTYFKSGGFILDRYEERPAYVFNYTDGITRKIYLYKIFSAADTKDLGLLAIYHNGKTGETKPFVIPGASADRKAWDQYIDDLKYIGEKELGLMSALTFVLSREMANLMAGGTGKTEAGGTKKKEEYNFCFAPDAPVTLPNGSAKAIADVAVGDVVLGYNGQTKAFAPTRVTRVDTHRGTFALVGAWLTPAQELSVENQAKPILLTRLEATANHPVLTASGRRALGEVRAGELLYRYEAGRPVAYRVVRVEARQRTAATVYNLATASGAYVVDGTVVLDK